MTPAKKINWKLMVSLSAGQFLIYSAGVLSHRHPTASVVCDIVGIWLVLQFLEITK